MTGMGGGHHDRAVVEAFQRVLLQQGLVVAALIMLVFVAWNVARSAQLRRAAAGEVRSTPPGDAGSEPVARRIVRVAFGLLWILDGVLQGQPSMPTSLVPDVIRPAAEGSPGWVRDLVASVSHVWTDHPVHAAAAAVWIQVGLGIWLLVARSGRWSSLAGAASAAWAGLAWIFGEAFGGVFGSGQSFLIGTPGAALFYLAAGVLVALPARVWSTERVGRVMLRAAGAFLVGMAVLQAWPGRGYWQGRTPNGAGTLLAMVRQMAGTGQPAVVASAVRGFAGFDAGHGWAVNLFVVVVLAATGGAFISGRRRAVETALVASLVLAAADWFLVQDMGVFGGVGTDPNSMVPWAVLLVAAYAARTRPRPVTPVAAAAPTTTVTWRSWRSQMADDPAGAVRTIAALAALGITLVGAAPMAAAALSTAR